MTEHYLELILDEARQTIESHPTVGRSVENPLHEHLRFAVLRLLENDTKKTHTGEPAVPGVTVGYGNDGAMFEHWGDDVEWWDDVVPQEHCTRFRIFYEKDQEEGVPRSVLEVMASLGAWRVWSGPADDHGSYDHRERNEVHFLWPWNHPIEELLASRTSTDDADLAADGGQAPTNEGDCGVDAEADQTSRDGERDELEPRTQRAREEDMDVSLLKKSGVYEVHSESGNIYEVDIIGESCTCLDRQQREPEGGCKHMRCVAMEVNAGELPRPDGRLPDGVKTDGGRDRTRILSAHISARIERLTTEIELRKDEVQQLSAAETIIEDFQGRSRIGPGDERSNKGQTDLTNIS